MSTEPPSDLDTILVVEDESEVAISLYLLLKTEGFRVIAAATGQSALQSVTECDLVVLDIGLPDISGYQVCRRIRQTPGLQDVPILLVSGRNGVSDRLRGLDAGANDYVVKPFDTDDLLARIRNLLRTRRIEEQLLLRERELRALRTLTATLVNAVDVTELAQRVVDAIPSAFGPSSGFIGGVLSTVDVKTHEIRAHAVTDLPVGRVALAMLQRPFGEIEAMYSEPTNLLHKTALEMVPHESEHLAEFASPTISQALADVIERVVGMKSGVAMPVVVQKRLVGVMLFVLGKPSAAITSSERKVMHDFVDAIGIVLENVRLYREAERLTVTDALTGVANRRRFDQAIVEETARAERLGYPLGVLIIDADHFKSVNDRYGHQRGDAVLVELASVVRGQVRQTDLVARYGGEEFAIILPGTDPGGLLAVAEKIRSAVNHRMSSGPVGALVTISLGGASSPPTPLNPSILVAAADAALYAAKRSGRNRAIVGIDVSPPAER